MISNYNKIPVNTVKGYDHHCIGSWYDIRERIDEITKDLKSAVIVVECYHGLYEEEILDNLSSLSRVRIIDVSKAYKKPSEIETLIYPEITDDPIFGRLTKLSINDYFDSKKLYDLQQDINKHNDEILIVFGIGASQIVARWDLLIYADNFSYFVYEN